MVSFYQQMGEVWDYQIYSGDVVVDCYLGCYQYSVVNQYVVMQCGYWNVKIVGIVFFQGQQVDMLVQFLQCFGSYCQGQGYKQYFMLVGGCEVVEQLENDVW